MVTRQCQCQFLTVMYFFHGDLIIKLYVYIYMDLIQCGKLINRINYDIML